MVLDLFISSLIHEYIAYGIIACFLALIRVMLSSVCIQLYYNGFEKRPTTVFVRNLPSSFSQYYEWRNSRWNTNIKLLLYVAFRFIPGFIFIELALFSNHVIYAFLRGIILRLLGKPSQDWKNLSERRTYLRKATACRI